MKTRKIAILGSTGSIGVNTLDVVSRMGGAFKVVALSAGKNRALLVRQARRFGAGTVCIGDALLRPGVAAAAGRGTKVLAGAEGLCDIASMPGVDMVVFAISGNACIRPLIRAIECRKAIALANKEAMVSAGQVIMPLARARGVKMIPIDSEHSAIFQCIEACAEPPAKIYLTGSGGPLLDVGAERFDRLGARFILDHPKWKMGRKISVDSATMMNKGLEIIEASRLFGVDEGRIEVLIHPEAVIHSMVEFSDASVIAQMAVPDMRLPIQYALTYPARSASVVGRVDFARLSRLSFRRPDTGKFPCLGLARLAARSGGTAPAALCASDEEAVGCYLAGSIKFSAIPEVIGKVLGRHRNVKGRASIGDILEADAWAREEARSLCCR